MLTTDRETLLTDKEDMLTTDRETLLTDKEDMLTTHRQREAPAGRDTAGRGGEPGQGRELAAWRGASPDLARSMPSVALFSDR